MKKLTLLLIIFLAIFLRFYNLSHVPPSASLDEASIGWNAYSILETGKDEYGNSFPVLLRAYDDYRPALYVYFVAPFVKVFGLSVLSVRLPSVILSVLTVLSTYLLVKELFKKQKILDSEKLALISAFLLAISPWHIYISRLGHEVNLAFSFFIFALLFFLRRNIYLSALFFLISFISYQSEKIFIPIIVLGIFLIFRKELTKYKRQIFFAFVLSFLILIPFLKATFSPNALIRFSGTSIFSAYDKRFENYAKLLAKAKEKGDTIGTVIYNRRVLGATILAEDYISHFNPSWLFTENIDNRFKAPGLGLLYPWELPFILVGIFFLIKSDFDPSTKKLIFLWVLSSPIAASLATDSPHALRTLTFLPAWQIFSGIGILATIELINNRNVKKGFVGVLLGIILINFLYFCRQYFYIFPVEQVFSFQFSLSKAVPYVQEQQNSYKKIVFSNRDSLYQSYMFFLFYSKYDPRLYQAQGGTGSGGYDKTHKFGKYEFRPIDFSKEQKGTLLVGNYLRFLVKGKVTSSVRILKLIKNLKNETKIIIAVAK